jgi:hypothetical protein
LERLADETDAAILLFTADDKTWYRNSERHEPRDNLLFEAGMFFAAHSRQRTQIMVPSYQDQDKQKKVAIASDLAGLTLSYFHLPDGDLEATGLPAKARQVCEALLLLGERPRRPTRLKTLAAHPEVSEIPTLVGSFRTMLNDGIVRLAQDPSVKEVDALVAYRMGDVGRTIHAACNRPGVKIRACFADMWDEPLADVYLRKYTDRKSAYMQNAIVESIEKLLGPSEFTYADSSKSLQRITPKQKPIASYKIAVTPQRITYSFYRIDETSFVVPLDMKLSQDPAPLSWTFSRETSKGVYDQYAGEYSTMFSEARLIYDSDAAS